MQRRGTDTYRSTCCFLHIVQRQPVIHRLYCLLISSCPIPSQCWWKMGARQRQSSEANKIIKRAEDFFGKNQVLPQRGLEKYDLQLKLLWFLCWRKKNSSVWKYYYADSGTGTCGTETECCVVSQVCCGSIKLTPRNCAACASVSLVIQGTRWDVLLPGPVQRYSQKHAVFSFSLSFQLFQPAGTIHPSMKVNAKMTLAHDCHGRPRCMYAPWAPVPVTTHLRNTYPVDSDGLLHDCAVMNPADLQWIWQCSSNTCALPKMKSTLPSM